MCCWVKLDDYWASRVIFEDMVQPQTLLPDPDMEGDGERLLRAVERYAKRLLPSDLCGLMDAPIESTFRNARKTADADGGAIWVTDAAREHLVVAYADPNTDIVGSEQPTSEGLISSVFASEQPICQNHVSADERHSKKIDEAVGEVTEAMMAVPFYVGGMLRGIFSVVRWLREEGETPNFSLQDFREFQRASIAMERLVTLSLSQLILGMDL